MPSNIAEALSLRFPPLAIFYAQEPPSDAVQLKPLCSMLLYAQACKGKTVAIKVGTCGCEGAGSGLALEALNQDNSPGGRDCFLRFLSIGNQGWEKGRDVIRQMTEAGAPTLVLREFSEGEGFLKTPELVDQWVRELPRVEPEGPYVIIQPLESVGIGDHPKVVSFAVDPDQLSALLVLANYAGRGVDKVRVPFAAGCASLVLYPFYEAQQEHPHAVIGLTDISARFYLRKQLGKDILSFTVPWSLFQEMEENVSESFLTRFAWKSIMES